MKNIMTQRQEIHEDKRQICIYYNDLEELIEMPEYDTVSDLKEEIRKHFNIPLECQLIEGWLNVPESDACILKFCTTSDDLNYLVVMDILQTEDVVNKGGIGAEKPIGSDYAKIVKSSNIKDSDKEVLAAISFNTKFINNYQDDTSVIFHICRLKEAINRCCLCRVEERKILLLYLHNSNDPFTNTFCSSLFDEEISKIIGDVCFVLGWDIEDEQYHNALLSALNTCTELSDLENFISSKIATVLCAVPIKSSITLISCMRGKTSRKDILTTLQSAEKFLIEEKQEEIALTELVEKTGSENDIGSVNYQKIMADMLGDRDYDSFEYNQHDLLKQKIAYALYGPPQQEDGYDKKQQKKTNDLYKTIVDFNRQIAKHQDRVEVSFIYNCTEPLPKDKIARAKKFSDSNPNTDVTPHPLFILRRCRKSKDPCRCIIDDTGRVYESWENYVKHNKLGECKMVLPKNGRYDVDSSGTVLLERHLSPSCGIDAKILKGTDRASTAGGLISGGIFVAAAIPAITVAPAALIAGGVMGIGVGLYSIGRSAYTLYDRSKHKETMSIANSEARGAYLNIVAGSLGFVGAGANMAVSQLALRGVNIGKGAGAVVNTIGVINIGAGGANLINSSYDVFDQWFNENQTPSLLTIVQLSSSVLFFGNAVYNFKTANTIVEEAQARTLQEYQDSLRSNRHRKTFTKLLKETIAQNNGDNLKGKAEVISVIRNIQNKDEVFAVLTRTNKAMNDAGVKFSAHGGEIKLNGFSVDMNELASLNKKDVKSLLVNLPESRVPTPSEISTTRSLITDTFNNFSLPNVEQLVTYSVHLLFAFTGDTKSKIISALASLLSQLFRDDQPVVKMLDIIFPHHRYYIRLLEMVVDYFNRSAKTIVEQHEKWEKTKSREYYSDIFEYINFNNVSKGVMFLESVIEVYFVGTNLKENALKELINYFYTWVTKQIYDYNENDERRQKREDHDKVPSEKVTCDRCGGYYYRSRNLKKK